MMKKTIQLIYITVINLSVIYKTFSDTTTNELVMLKLQGFSARKYKNYIV